MQRRKKLFAIDINDMKNHLPDMEVENGEARQHQLTKRSKDSKSISKEY